MLKLIFSNLRIFKRVCQYTFSILIIWTLCIDTHGQQIIASLDLDRKEPRPLWFEYCKADEGLVTISYLEKNSSRRVGIFKYDANFKRQWNRELFQNSNRKQIEYLIVLNARILVFISQRFPKEKRTDVFYYEFDLAGNSLTNEKLLFSSPDNNTEGDIMNYTLSLNKKHLLVLERPHTNRNTQKELKGFLFAGGDTLPYTPVKIELPFNTDQIAIKNIRLTNNGDIALLMRLNIQDKIKTSADVKYQVIRYLAPEFIPIPIEIQYPDVYVTDLVVKPDREGNLLLGGFFSNKNSSQVAGLLFGRIDGMAHEITTLNKQEFSKEFLSQYLSPRQIERKRELADFYLDELVLRSDGGMLFITEQYYLSSTSYRDIYGFWYNRDLYHYDDVVVFSVSAEGKIEWNSAITKSQSSESPSELSYLGLVGSEYLYILYKTRIKGMGTNVFVSRIEYDGTTTQAKPFFPFSHSSDAFYRSFSEQISNDQAIIVYYNGKNKTFSLSKVVF